MRCSAATVVLPLLVAVVNWPVIGYGFLNWDDRAYVTANPLVSAGLTFRGIAEAFVSFACFNWHRLTLVSHMLDVSLFSDWVGGHHLTNVLLHTVNALLVLTLAWRLTLRWPESLVVAAVFAAHPQRVESVAWVSERKDLLCGLFFLGSVLAYLRFTAAAELRSRSDQPGKSWVKRSCFCHVHDHGSAHDARAGRGQGLGRGRSDRRADRQRLHGLRDVCQAGRMADGPGGDVSPRVKAGEL